MLKKGAKTGAEKAGFKHGKTMVWEGGFGAWRFRSLWNFLASLLAAWHAGCYDQNITG